MEKTFLVVMLMMVITGGVVAAGGPAGQPCRAFNGEEGRCRLLVDCTTFFADLAGLSRLPCQLSVSQGGVCCPLSKLPVAVPKLPPSPPPPAAPTRITPEDLNRGCERSVRNIRAKQLFERQLLDGGVVAPPDSPVFMHARLFETTPPIIQRGEDGAVMAGAALGVAEDLQLSREQAAFQLPQHNARETILGGLCRPLPVCTNTRYRTIDGTCNNLNNPAWGSAGAPFFRILKPDYGDGLNSPRRSRAGAALPSARALSTAVIRNTDARSPQYTLLLMQWGQFLDHDLTHTPISKGSDNSDVTCCAGGSVRPPSQLHPECLPIEIPDTDDFYGALGQRCMEFVRSMPAMQPDCSFGPREQMNQITAYIDASNVYGSSAAEERRLRSGQGGRLHSTADALLPPTADDGHCRRPAPRRHCFAAGDTRVNEQPNLAVLHTVWMRQHNQLAAQLASLNPHWGDDILFHEARRIVGAMMQHITYNEYLPIVLGRHFVETFGLLPLDDGYSSYDPDTDATISNVFATAAFRYGHTLIDGAVQGFSQFGLPELAMNLSSVQFAPFMLYRPGVYDALVRGLATQSSQQFDNSFSEQLTEHLFAGSNGFGMDLVALNLQRGRDHGLPGYSKWRAKCQLPPVTSFQGLSDVMHPDAASYLQLLYSHVDDIDVFLGATLEFPVAGALVGHTFLCVLGDQFYRLKAGDRFYYEHGGQEGSFTPAQLTALRRVTLSRVLCDTARDLPMMQPLALLHANYTNKRALCRHGDLIPRLDLSPWRAA